MCAAPCFFILIAPYFDEVAVVSCLSEIRQAGLTAVLVGTTVGLLNGRRGTCLRPDQTLTELRDLSPQPKQSVIIAGGAESAAVVLADPRAHQLMRQVLDNGGYVVGLLGTQQLMAEAGLLLSERSCRWLQQEVGVETAVFVHQLVHMILKD